MDECQFFRKHRGNVRELSVYAVFNKSDYVVNFCYSFLKIVEVAIFR